MRIHHDRGTDNIIQDGPEKTFYAWDLNDDGFVDKEEVNHQICLPMSEFIFGKF